PASCAPPAPHGTPRTRRIRQGEPRLCVQPRCTGDRPACLCSPSRSVQVCRTFGSTLSCPYPYSLPLRGRSQGTCGISLLSVVSGRGSASTQSRSSPAEAAHRLRATPRHTPPCTARRGSDRRCGPGSPRLVPFPV
ncbi:hypothetical protein PV325_012142, partial [Microctonus aethiopoides]